MRRFLLVISTILVLLVAVSLASAQSRDLDLVWFTIEGIGASSAGNGYTLSGTVGQADPGSPTSGIYSVEGGFWEVTTASAVLSSEVYLPLIQK
jgi:hypothetical protein